MRTKTRGLEPIVAAVLLIVVAVIGAVLVYLWFAGYVTKATSQAEQLGASEKLKIEAANLTTNKAVLIVRNLTNAPVSFSAAYIYQAGSSSAICGPLSLSSSSALTNDKNLVKVNVDVSSCGIISGRDYTIKLVTVKGTEVAVTVTATS